ncbi:MAG: hypothetical protein M3380_12845 [Chloroflexota bacterium]|nr:hypothetical protein [Chloroflexota bacterium]
MDEQALAPAQNGVFTTAMLRELRRFVKLQPLHGILQSSLQGFSKVGGGAAKRVAVLSTMVGAKPQPLC